MVASFRISQYSHKMRIGFLVVSACSLVSSANHLEVIARRSTSLAVFVVMMISLNIQKRNGTTATATACEEAVDFRRGVIEIAGVR